MAIAPTGAAYKSLTFDNKTSREFGVYITGEAVYNAPEREVEMISIPGRNGAFALDKGRFENVTVTYPAGIFADNETDFAAAISDFRNYLCSRKGYCRLTDEYNPNEYRMAVYKSGLEVDPAQLRAGEFEITFDCKPQRWLTSGETPVTIASSGDTITNPTLFNSGPLLEVKGYGTIDFNGFEIEIDSGQIGEITLSNGGSATQFDIDENNCNVGDDLFVVNGSEVRFRCMRYGNIQNITITPSIGNAGTVTYELIPRQGSLGHYFLLYCNFSQLDYLVGTSGDKIIEFDISSTNDTPTTKTAHVVVKYSYISDANPRVVITYNITGDLSDNTGGMGPAYSTKPIKAISTISRLGNPTYIDCDIGEAYLINAGTPISLNQYIDLGSILPTLSPGSNAITFDNTITDLKITPRWWKV